MRIDLLLSPKGEVGLVSDENFKSPVSAIIFDREKFTLFLEFGATMDTLECNIPISMDYIEEIEEADYMYIGVINKNIIVDANRVPIGMNSLYRSKAPLKLTEYENFWNTTTQGQPLYRDDLSEKELATIVRDMRGVQLEFARELRKQREMEILQSPQPIPQAPAPKAPGLDIGGSMMGGGTPIQRRPIPPQQNDDGSNQGGNNT